MKFLQPLASKDMIKVNNNDSRTLFGPGMFLENPVTPL